MGVTVLDNGKMYPLEGAPDGAVAADSSEAANDRAAETLAKAIDRATGFTGTDADEPGTGEEKAEKPGKRRDWVEEAYVAFIEDAHDIEPTDPVKAVAAYFERNASDELKARCKAEGKDARGCWRFVEAVARKALHGSSGHIDPGVVYAIAMHWFEDVPKDWDARGPKAPARKKAAAGAAATGQAADHGGRQAAATEQGIGHNGRQAATGQEAAATGQAKKIERLDEVVAQAKEEGAGGRTCGGQAQGTGEGTGQEGGREAQAARPAGLLLRHA